MHGSADEIAKSILKKKDESDDHESEDGEDADDSELYASNILDAIKSGDASDLVSSLKDFIKSCS